MKDLRAILILTIGFAALIWLASALMLNDKSKTYEIRIFSDPETGCEYLVLENKAISPRIDNRGGIICKDPKRAGL